MDIKSSNEYPSCELSNFCAHEFIFRGQKISSMEGLLQSVKVENKEEQKKFFTLVGFAAKKAGKPYNWKLTQTLYWQGIPMKRNSDEYFNFLDEAYDCLGENKEFRDALLASGNSFLTHSIGKTEITQTILTEQEFCSRLMKLREKLQNGNK